MTPPPGGGDGNGINGGGRSKIVPLHSGSEKLATSTVEAKAPESKPISDLPIGKTQFGLRSGRTGLRRLLKKPLEIISPHSSLLDKLTTLANPLPNGGFNATFIRQGTHFHLLQKQPGSPIQLTISKEVSSDKSSPPKLKQQMKVEFPAGLERSKMSAPQTTAIRYVENMLTKRVERIQHHRNAFERFMVPLKYLKGRIEVGNQSVWYHNYVILDGKVYTIRRQNLALEGIQRALPQDLSHQGQFRAHLDYERGLSLNQITVFEQSGGKRSEILSFSASGEVQYEPNRGARRLPNNEQNKLLEKLIAEVYSAKQNFDAYQEKLHKAIVPLNEGRPEPIQIPTVEPSLWTEAPPKATQGTLGEPILHAQRGWDLWKWSRPWWLRAPSHTWQNPDNPSEVRKLRPKGAIRRAMFRELGRWVLGALWYGGTDSIRNLRLKGDKVKLHLFPEGGGELTVYRSDREAIHKAHALGLSPDDAKLAEYSEGNLYNIIKMQPGKPKVNLAKTIKAMAKKNPAFKDLPRSEQILQAANQARLDTQLRAQRIPPLPIDQIHQIPIDPFRKPLQILDAQGAWEAIQQLPELKSGEHPIEPRVQIETKGSLTKRALGFNARDSIRVDFPRSHPETKLTIRSGEGSLGKRVEIQLWQGDNYHAVVYDNGSFNQAEAINLNTANYNETMKGKVPRNFWALIGQGYGRLYNYTRFNGGAYGVGHFFSYPIAWGYESLFYTPQERKLIGTPFPNLSLKSLWHGCMSFGFMMGGSGFSAITLDAGFNINRTWLTPALREWRAGHTTLWESLRNRSGKIQILNADPSIRYLGKSRVSTGGVPGRVSFGGFARGFLQRAVPLMGGLMALEKYETGHLFSKHTLPNFFKVGAVSFASAALWHGIRATRGGTAVAKGFKFIGKAAHGGRLQLTFRGTLATVILEFAALRIWDSIERQRQLEAQGVNFRKDLARTMDARNSLISRLQRGEEISPRILAQADSEFQQAVARYRSFLKLIGKKKGEGKFASLSLDNEFGDEFKRYYRELGLLRYSSTPTNVGDLAQARLRHQQKISELRSRRSRLEGRLRKLYIRYKLPVPTKNKDSDSPGLREFLARSARRIQKNPHLLDGAVPAAFNGPDTPTRNHVSPIAMDSPQAKAILRHFRWKTNQDPAFPHWDKDRRASYLRWHFRGFRVKQADGHYRPWSQKEALAFLDLVQLEEFKRAGSLKPSLTQPETPSAPLKKLTEEVEKIYREEQVNNPYVENNSHRLARNIPDLNKQISDYIEISNARLNRALTQFLPKDLLAMGPKSAGTIAKASRN